VLRARGDARAASRLQAAQAQLLAHAAQIRDPVQRDGYLRRVPHHHALLQADADQPPSLEIIGSSQPKLPLETWNSTTNS
jgi:hypothetical protein